MQFTLLLSLTPVSPHLDHEVILFLDLTHTSHNLCSVRLDDHALLCQGCGQVKLRLQLVLAPRGAVSRPVTGAVIACKASSKTTRFTKGHLHAM